MRKEKQSQGVNKIGANDKDPLEANAGSDAEILQVRRVVAGNPNTPRPVLMRLAEDRCEAIRRAVAENPRTPAEVLKNLAYDSCAEVRLAVAENKHAPAEILGVLAGDESVDVRFGVAESPHMPQDILIALARDENPYVRCRALKTLQMLAPSLQSRLKLMLSNPIERVSGA